MSNPFADAAARTAQPQAQAQAQNFQPQGNAPQGHAPGTDPWGQAPQQSGSFGGQPETVFGNAQNAQNVAAANGFGQPAQNFQGQPAQNTAPTQAPQGNGFGQPAQAQPGGFGQTPGGNTFGQGGNPGFANAGAPEATAPAAGGDPFSTPTGGGGAKVADYFGNLLLVKPLELIKDMQTSIGTSDAMRADAYILDGTIPGEEVTDMLFFQQALRRDLERTLRGGSPFLLGRLGRGTAKQGKSAPWIFESPTEQDQALARQFLASRG